MEIVLVLGHMQSHKPITLRMGLGLWNLLWRSLRKLFRRDLQGLFRLLMCSCVIKRWGVWNFLPKGVEVGVFFKMGRCSQIVNEEKQIYQCGFFCLSKLKISHILIIHGHAANGWKSGQFANWSRFQKNPAASLTMKKPLISQGSGFVILWFWTRQRTGCPDFRHTMWNPFEKFHTLRRSNQSRRSVLISWWVCPIRMNSMWCHRVGWSWQCGCRVIWHLCNPLNQPRLRC